MSRWMVSGGAGRLVVALGVGAFDGLGEDSRFIGVGFVGSCSMSIRKLLLFHCSVLIAQFGSLRASKIEGGMGGRSGRNVDICAHDDWRLRFGGKKGGRVLLLRLLVGFRKVEANGGHGGWG